MSESIGSKDSTERDETTKSGRNDRFEVLALPEDCSKLQTSPTEKLIVGELKELSTGSQKPKPLNSSEPSDDSSTSDPALKELLPTEQLNTVAQVSNQRLSYAVWRNLTKQQQQLRLLRAQTKRIGKHSINSRNCRSTPVLTTLSPLYRIAMRKPKRRLSNIRDTNMGRISSARPKTGRRPFGASGRPCIYANVKSSGQAPLMTSRMDKSMEVDLEDLSIQDVSISTTTPPSGFINPKKLGKASMTPAPFVLIRHKSHHIPIVRQRCCRHPSRRRSHPVLWCRKPRPARRPGSNGLSTQTSQRECTPMPLGRAHSFCVPYSHGLENGSEKTQIIHSDNSSIDCDANDPEYSLWRTRIKSYLDAAAQADALIRSQYRPSAVRQRLSSTNEYNQLGVDNSTNNGSLRGTAERRKLKTNSMRIVDYQEPFLNFWDDYQLYHPRPYSAPLYSSSSDTDGGEPVSTYAEEFPWDDMAASCLSDASQEDLFLREIQASKPKSSPYAPFLSTITTPANAENSVDQLPAEGDAAESPVFRQDTMDLSTSTSVLFNQKSSSLEVSFEVCSQSATVGDNLDIPENQSNETELLCGMRTHPDGGSQHCLNSEPTSEVVEILVPPSWKPSPNQTTTPCTSFLESHFLKPSPPANTERCTSSLKSSHSFFNPYMMDSRKCQTLPRAVSKRKRRQHLTYDTKATVPVGESRLSASASLDKLQDWSDCGPRLDIIRFSQQRLRELKTLLHRLMRIAPSQNGDAKTDTYTGMTLHHWQNSLSHLIHLAEANLQLLTDNTLRSMVCSGKCSCKNKGSTKIVPHNWSNCPELTCVQLQWIRFIYQARYWLLQSYSQDSMQRQLSSLKSRIFELNQTIQRVLTPSVTVTAKCKTVPLPTGLDTARSTLPESTNCSKNEELKKQIQYCVNEVETVNTQVQRLREEFERHVIHEQLQLQKQQQHTCDFESGEPTKSFVALRRDDNLVRELDQLTKELSANQQRLSNWLARQSDMQTPNTSDEQDWEYLEHPKESMQFSENTSEENDSKITMKEHDAVETSTQIVLCQPSTTEKSKPNRYIVLTIIILALACFCCFLVMQVTPCENRPFRWHISLLVLERLFGLGDDVRRGCPLRRERLSSLVDYTPGSLPF